MNPVQALAFKLVTLMAAQGSQPAKTPDDHLEIPHIKSTVHFVQKHQTAPMYHFKQAKQSVKKDRLTKKSCAHKNNHKQHQPKSHGKRQG